MWTGSSFYWKEPCRNIEKGRECYQTAIDLIAGENDPFLIVTIAAAYRDWASQEISEEVREKEYVMKNLSKAHEYLKKLPDSYSPKYDELRRLAVTLAQLGVSYFQSHLLDKKSRQEKAREIFSSSVALLQPFGDDINKDYLGQIYQEWASNEFFYGDNVTGSKVIEQAKQCY